MTASKVCGTRTTFMSR